MANNHALFSSLYENPLAAGDFPAEAPLAAHHGRLVEYLLRDDLNDATGTALGAVESLPHVPPRAQLNVAAVESLPSLPPRALLELAPVASLPTIPPRALDFAPVASLPTIPPRA